MTDKLKIVIAASEAVPFAKTGGLADVAGALPVHLEKLGHHVCLIMPYYRMAKKSQLHIEDTGHTIVVQISDKLVEGRIFRSTLGDDVTVYLIRNDDYYDRPELYSTPEGDYTDNAERFIFYSKAVLKVLKKFNLKPDIIHCNDWQTGLIPVLLKYQEQDNNLFEHTATVFTIHNLAYQGLFWHLDMPLTNLSWDVFTPEGIEFFGKINLMKAGIVFSDVINTVSKKYSKEIQTPEFGCGLEGVLTKRSKDLYGIVNGVDYQRWNPEIDPFIKCKYSPSDMRGKKLCKEDLLLEFGLKNRKDVPVIGIISRLADQKGFDLIAEAIEDIMKLDIFFILLGTGSEKYHRLFKSIAEKYPQKAGIKLTFNNRLAHKIEAGSDFFLMPSRYEPCGLNQLYSLKYGTIPIVRATGGLDDTIKNYNPKTKQGNGFSFKTYSSKAMLAKIKEALKVYHSKDEWKHLVLRCMELDYSWLRSAKLYEQLYRTALTKKNKAVSAK